jgi:hypothetical protein
MNEPNSRVQDGGRLLAGVQPGPFSRLSNRCLFVLFPVLSDVVLGAVSVNRTVLSVLTASGSSGLGAPSNACTLRLVVGTVSTLTWSVINQRTVPSESAEQATTCLSGCQDRSDRACLFARGVGISNDCSNQRFRLTDVGVIDLCEEPDFWWVHRVLFR